MRYIPLLASLTVGVLLGFFLNAGVSVCVLTVVLAFIGHVLAARLPGRSETIYWLGLLALLLLILLNWQAFTLGRFIMIAPLVILIGHFVSRSSRRFFPGKA